VIDKSVEKLRADSVEHLQYEIRMMQETARRLLHDRPLHDDVVLKNAVVESCVVHARSLTGFIYPDDAHTDDITSDDYVVDKKAAWAAARGTIPPILVMVKVRTAKEIAHLTTQRRGDDDPAKSWPLVEIIEALHGLLKRFVDYAVTGRLDPSVTAFIKGLQSPMASTVIGVYNSLSTGLTTATKPLRFRTDVGTVSPDQSVAEPVKRPRQWLPTEPR
jgi:hypothetical protein